MTEPRLYVPDTRLQRAYIIDVDGTLAHNNGHRDWYEYSKVGGDDPDLAVIHVVRALYSYGARIIILSGREDSCYNECVEWFAQHRVGYDELYMRATGDYRQDAIVKTELFDNHIRDRFNVLGVFDDRPQVCRMWRQINVKTFQVGDPEVEF